MGDHSLRIGILPRTEVAGGGTYQYCLNMISALSEMNGAEEDHYILFVQDPDDPTVRSLNAGGWEVQPLGQPASRKKAMLRRIIGDGLIKDTVNRFRHRSKSNEGFPDPEIVQRNPIMDGWFKQHKVDLMVYPAPSPLAFETGTPYVMAIHDLQHRLQPEFPEVSADGEYENREHLFRNGIRSATLIIADSEVGKEDILNFYGPYGATPDKVKVLPYLPAHYLAVDVSESERRRVRETYDLRDKYLFYPAQFWPHKNHARIIEALALLKQEHCLEPRIVFVGGSSGPLKGPVFEDVMSLGRHLGVDKQIYYLGYVPDEDMSALYAEAAALIFPTFFGPSNIPPLEAWAFGCPVLTSDIRGVREQMGDGAVLVDPRSVEEIADGILRLLTDDRLCEKLVGNGYRLLSAYTQKDYRRKLSDIIAEAKERVS